MKKQNGGNFLQSKAKQNYLEQIYLFAIYCDLSTPMRLPGISRS